jgi:small conductance mechanosensitive channel
MLETYLDLIVLYGTRLIIAFLLAWIGFPTIKKIVMLIRKGLEKSHMDPNLKPFLGSLAKIGLQLILLIIIVAVIGVNSSSVLALLASFGFAVGLALQGSLSNFAGGILLLTIKPIRVGDFVEADGMMGTVENIQILYTALRTPDNKFIFIPNGALANNRIINYSIKPERRVDLKINVSYKTDHNQVVKIIENIIKNHKLILHENDYLVRLSEHAQNALVYNVRVWSKKDDYWTVYYDLMEQIKVEFDKNNIEIPYNKMDVYLKTDK